MNVFRIIIFSLPLADLLWWWWADRRLRPLRRSTLWRILLAAFIAVELLGYAWIVGGRFIGVRNSLPAIPLAVVYLWHLFILPAAVVLTLIVALVFYLRSWIGRRDLPTAREDAQTPHPTSPRVRGEESGPTRRQVLAAVAAALPPIVTSAMVGRALSQLDDFRINRLVVPLRDLPRDLDGMTIAHVSDVHLGRFTRTQLLPRVAEVTNALRSDLVMLTGDLLDFSISDLTGAIDFVRKLDPRSGLFMVEGNHDLFEDRAAFESRVVSAGIPLLLNESRTARIRGVDVQVLGIKWGGAPRGADVRARMRGGLYDIHTTQTLAQLKRDPGVFPVLLAHHPHAFDLAAEADVPLTLAGHTHGGQLMLTRSLGPGPMMFKYWSGLYRKQDATRDSALVVSNGVGNWFPLRINAPAEIVHITLRRA